MNIKQKIESLSPNERKILPHLESKNINQICVKSNLDKTSVLRSLEYLSNKGLVELEQKTAKIINFGINGLIYKKKGLPERRLINILSEKRIIPLNEAQKQSKLSNEEFKAALGALKNKALVSIKNKKLVLDANKEEISKTFLEEQLIDKIPIEINSLTPEQEHALEILRKRKEIIEIKEDRIYKIKVTELGKEIQKSNLGSEKFIEQINPELLKKDSNWKGKKFRRYDIESPVPKIYGGKRHFVNQAIDYGRKIWTDMGFEEMTGDLIQTSFWNFDALFTAQDHPVREMQDTFFINKKTNLPEDKKLIENIKNSHEEGVDGSSGWQYKWDEEDAKKLVLRTHTTCLSAKKLYELSKLPVEQRKGKFFAIGKNFRNETIDWSHGFEFNQTEGIVVDENVNFRQLLGYLKQFFKKMGFENIRFSPAYFPYTEPSVEIHVWHPEKKLWLELGGAGIFRPEVVIPLLGKNIPVLAWGPGFDRVLIDYYKISDLRELYKNDINKLRKMSFWVK
ncbi:phenylalanine--tRNA ligase subunit alpha [Candidatus Pacearchaeota archaeon]|nr:phenylalanine--tRNA ligase subunit alpha [Candidatus Pacearchaeota archaeon]